MPSTLSDILEAVKDGIINLGLDGCEEIAVRAEPKDGDDFYPGITISQMEEREYRGTNERDDIGYPIQITMVVNNDVDPSEDDRFADWRQQIRKKFIHQKLSAVSTISTCQIEHGPVYAKTQEHLDIGTMVLVFINREART